MIRGRWRFLVGSLLLHLHIVVSLQSPPVLGRRNMKTSFTLLQSSTTPAMPAMIDYVDRDSYWVYMFYLLMLYKSREGNCDVCYRHEENDWKLGVWVAKQREACKIGRLDPIYRERLEEAGVVWDPLLQRWETMIGLLLQFKQREGHCLVPQLHQEKSESLGSWLNTQRREQRSGKLQSTRRKQLEEIGVVWNAPATRWDQMYRLLLQFKGREGHCQVPIHHKEEGENLGSWLSTQRKAKRGNTSKIDRQDQLEKAGVVWDVQRKQWGQMFKLFLQFKDREGHCQIPINHKEEGNNLGHWIAKQQCLHRANKLDPIYQERLEEAGFVWDPFMQRWESMFDVLLRFKKREGHSQVPIHHKEEGRNLGRWLSTQRMEQRSGELQSSRRKRLEETGVVWNIKTMRWDQMYLLLLQFNEREGHCQVPRHHKEEGKNLGSWLDTQRTAKSGNSFRKDRLDQLEEAGVIWNVPNE
jgi:hypothetical protein